MLAGLASANPNAAESMTHVQSIPARLGTYASWPEWVPIQSGHWLILAGLGISGAVGQYAVTVAFSRAAASRIAPLEYTALVWGILLDRIFWNTLPDVVTLMGAAVIISSGLYLLRHEHVHAEAEHP